MSGSEKPATHWCLMCTAALWIASTIGLFLMLLTCVIALIDVSCQVYLNKLTPNDLTQSSLTNLNPTFSFGFSLIFQVAIARVNWMIYQFSKKLIEHDERITSEVIIFSIYSTIVNMLNWALFFLQLKFV